jgi:hypothetical protein
LGIVGEPPGLPLARRFVPKNPLNQEESKVNHQEHLPIETTKNTQIEAVSKGLLDLDHQAKRHEVLIRAIQQETPPKFPHGNSKKKAPKISKKEKWEEHKQALRNHAESSIHSMKGSYNV